MNYSELKVLVTRAIEKLYELDSVLFTQDASEWAIAHRLAVYLEQEIPGWDVDCEYNRQGISQDIKKMSDECNVRPDIIIHRRGMVEACNNLLVIELKKRAVESDSKKVCDYTKPADDIRKFQYQFGLAVSVVDGPILRWYKMGRTVN